MSLMVRRGIFFAQIVALCMTTCASFVIRQQGRFREGNKMSELHLYITEMQRIMTELAESNDEYERRELRVELAETVAWGNDTFTPEQIALGWAMSLEEVNA